MGVAPKNDVSRRKRNSVVLTTASMLVEMVETVSQCALATYKSDCAWLSSKPVGCEPVTCGHGCDVGNVGVVVVEIVVSSLGLAGTLVSST